MISDHDRNHPSRVIRKLAEHREQQAPMPEDLYLFVHDEIERMMDKIAHLQKMNALYRQTIQNWNQQ
jgi:hypothetical protein